MNNITAGKGKTLMGCLLMIALLAMPASSQTTAGKSRQANLPRVFLLNARKLEEARKNILAGHQSSVAALAKLEREARQALEAESFSVVNKAVIPPSKDKHDYLSQAPYFWPDPHIPNGLPYIRRDGERNPEIIKITDAQNMSRLAGTTATLALAYYLKGDEQCAAKAAQLLRAWFLAPATKMNPHLNYAQFVPGVNDGRGIGIIESRSLTQVVDAVGLLAGSKAWTETDQQGLQSWFAKYLRWLLESPNGKAEAAAKNNHGTWYDTQVVSFALFTGDRELAATVLRESRQKRIARQIASDGRQPLELERTRAWSYSVMNLQGLFDLATLGEAVGLELWDYQTPDRRGLRKALDWLIQFADGTQKWSYPQIREWSPAELAPLLRQAALKYHESKYEDLRVRLAGNNSADRMNLLNPQMAR